MTPQEQQMLDELAARVNQTTLQDKDPEAEHFLQQSLGRNPDALYILAQTVLVQQYGLDQARKQLDELRNQPPPPPPAQKHTSFLGSLLGTQEEQPDPRYAQTPYAPVNQPGGYPPPYAQQQYPQPPYAQPSYAQPSYAQPSYAQPQYAQPSYGPPQGGGFLQSALRTATGVAAGALAFEGLESLFHGFGGGGNSRGFGDFGAGGREEIVNNYYGDSGREHERVSGDIEDRRDEGRQGFLDTSNDNSDSFADQSADSGDNSDPDTDQGDFSSDDSNS